MTEVKERIAPYKGTSHDRLCALIKEAQILPMPPTVTFTFTEPVDEPSYGDGGTSVGMEFHIPPSYTSQQVAISYYRLSLEVLKNLPYGELLAFDGIEYPTSSHKIIDRINHALGLDLLVDEIEDLDLLERPSRMPIHITERCLAWVPGLYYFDMLPIPYEARITMDDVVRITQTGRIRIISVKPIDSEGLE